VNVKLRCFQSTRKL